MERKQILSTIYYALRMRGDTNSKRDFADTIDFHYTNLSSAFNGNEQYLTDNLFKKILSAYPQLNPDFIWKGTGEVFIDRPMSGTETDFVNAALEKGLVEVDLTENTRQINLPLDPDEIEPLPRVKVTVDQDKLNTLIKELGEQRKATERAQAQTEKALAQIDKLIEIIQSVSIK